MKIKIFKKLIPAATMTFLVLSNPIAGFAQSNVDSIESMRIEETVVLSPLSNLNEINEVAQTNMHNNQKKQEIAKKEEEKKKKLEEEAKRIEAEKQAKIQAEKEKLASFMKSMTNQKKTLNNMVYFNQTEEPYANYQYGSDNMYWAGCGPTAIAMVASSLTGKEISPLQMADFSKAKGNIIPGGGTDWNLFGNVAKEYGLKIVQTTDQNQAISALARGAYVINSVTPALNGYWTNNGHFIVLAGMKDGKVLVNDPASRSRSSQSHSIEQVFVPSKQLWIIEKAS